MKFQLNNKGYLQLDFLFVVLFFTIVFSLFYGFHQTNEHYYVKSIEQKTLQVTAQDICMILISQSGEPNSWESSISTHTILGLQLQNTTQLSYQKVDALFNQMNYSSVLNSFDINGVLSLKLYNYSTKNLLYSMGEGSQSTSQSGKTQCYSTLNSSNVMLQVEVWR